ncbi:thyroid receptor-interacting protein 11 [Malaya genurostris]|uniref:thyroid receptor-interacting protein 11 n=1 Tax=Malaya genurostris TaxID=325434 RepID=UPI0026F3B601|nr:thyroid receptor-interacting protein 11 [Malaya genurostris]
MSWLKLNDSLNKVKGQITSFAQEVLAEGIVEEDENEAGQRFNPVLELGQAREKIDELMGLCATQDQEITTLRKQIAEYQQHQQSQPSKPPTEHPSSSSKLSEQPGSSSTDGTGVSSSVLNATTSPSALEDSWFWDPEQNVSSTSSSSKKDDENDSPRSGTDLTTIPLEAPASEAEIIERLLRQLNERSQQLKKQQLENALLGEKLTQVSNENRELNENIDELDRQHELVVENLLGVKKGLQEKCLQLEEELRVKQGEAAAANDLDEVRAKYDKLEQSYVSSCQENVRMKAELERLVVENIDTVAELEIEIAELKKNVQSSTDAEQRLNSLTECRARLEEQLTALTDENEQIREKFEEAQSTSAQYNELKAKYDNLVANQNEVLQQATDQAEVANLQRRNDELSSEAERWKTDCDRLQEDNLALQKSEKQLQTKLSETEERITQLEQRLSAESQVEQLQREVSELQNELRSVIIDNSVQLDAKEKEWQEKLNFVKAENSRIQHSKDTLEADLMQYEKECSNLMKNNELLISEIDNLKCKKLETINENAEDSVVILEKQLEDCSKLNKSLEDEYQEVIKKLEEVLEEREEFESKVESLQKTLETKTQSIKDLQLKVETLEQEKSNLVFEINEEQSKPTAQETNEEIEVYKTQMESLQAQLTAINEDHASLVLKLQTQQQNSVEKLKNSEAKISELESTLKVNKSEIDQLQDKLQQKMEELSNLKAANESTRDKNLQLLQDRLEAESQKSTALAVEKDEIGKQLNEMRGELDKSRAECEQLTQTYAAQSAEQSALVDSLTQQKDNLVQLITVKHNENVQYHAEIQRLSQLLQTQLTEKTEPDLAPPVECQTCPVLREQLSSLEDKTKKLDDFERMTDQIQFLREKSEILTNNLLTEQNNQKLLQQEKHDLVDQKNGLAKDLERLRHHLLEIEEAHTQETVELQQRYDDTRAKLQALEEDVKKSTNALTSASIRANQHAETLQTQYQLLQQQRDELVAKLNSADDRDQKNLASLTNLQCALEQFQINKDRDIELATASIRKELEQCHTQEANLKADIRQLQQQLADAKNGLLAAARISDQLEIAQVTVAGLKNELVESNEKYHVLERRLQATEASQADKVEKTLVKNLIIGYVVAPNQNDKFQILKLISAVLTMDQAECIKIGLNRSGGSWFNNILGSGGTPGTTQNYNKESLTEAFVKFLEKESAPRSTSTTSSGLLNVMSHEHPPQSTVLSRTTTPTQQQQTADKNQNPIPATPAAVQPILLGESSLLQQTTFQPARSSSSILKDILSDS